jgi:hypothetical protein
MRTTRDETNKVKVKALRDYRRNEPLKVIAIRYGYSPATISLWAKAAGIKRRTQGCRIKHWPSETDMQIVEEVRAVRDGRPTLEEIGKRWNMSRANVHRIFHTWKDWHPPSHDFAPGDRVRFLRRDYEVVTAGPIEGVVRDLKTGRERNLRWRSDARGLVVKLNVNERKQPQPADLAAA